MDGKPGLFRSMPGEWDGQLAESWTMSKDGLAYEFVLRKGVRFHNGDPLTAEDVKFSFERYHGAAAKLLKDRVREITIVDLHDSRDDRARRAAEYAEIAKLGRDVVIRSETRIDVLPHHVLPAGRRGW